MCPSQGWLDKTVTTTQVQISFDGGYIEANSELMEKWYYFPETSSTPSELQINTNWVFKNSL